ncbi:hypothetical protein KBX50_08500 [Micromonospora sp. C51]|uniref:hypothetical protein n=1 Tax=Micromonospora sp. C51 TaxID=2824879 RepID=UPI001B391006|nr:hypothetical protein [Micromonospora sp. C51]MBQ1048503.1 hypothetical protein [Micromonospora sp. C51]
MKIVRLQTGARCIALPEDQVIFVDPALDSSSAREAIQQALPDAHPDVVQHWVEAVLPTAAPLSVEERSVGARPMASLRGAALAAGRTTRRLTAVAVWVALGAITVPLLQGAEPTVVVASQAWENEIFSRIEVESAWECKAAASSDLVALCATPEGTVMHAEAWVGPNSVTFTFSYRDKQDVAHRNTMMVFSSPAGLQAWLDATPDPAAHPNMIRGERWVLYGSDLDRLQRWAQRLGTKVILPGDVTHAAITMGLLPALDGDQDDEVAESNVPAAVRSTAARVIIGDASLPSVTAMPTALPLNVPAEDDEAPAPAPLPPSPAAPAPAPLPSAAPPAATPAPQPSPPATTPAPLLPPPAPSAVTPAPPAPTSVPSAPPDPVPTPSPPATSSAPTGSESPSEQAPTLDSGNELAVPAPSIVAGDAPAVVGEEPTGPDSDTTTTPPTSPLDGDVSNPEADGPLPARNSDGHTETSPVGRVPAERTAVEGQPATTATTAGAE